MIRVIPKMDLSVGEWETSSPDKDLGDPGPFVSRL